jgi:hypothetical protein
MARFLRTSSDQRPSGGDVRFEARRRPAGTQNRVPVNGAAQANTPMAGSQTGGTGARRHPIFAEREFRSHIGAVSTLDDAVAAFNPTERINGKTIIRVRP